MQQNRLVLVVGQEGSGKSTTLRALAPRIHRSAEIDAEFLARINPWSSNDAALELLWRNVADITRNFWDAGFYTVVAGSFISNQTHDDSFRTHLTEEVDTFVIHLCAGKEVRDRRRIARGKSTTQDWRRLVDTVDPEDHTLGRSDRDYRYLRVENDDMTVDEVVERVRAWAPELFANNGHLPVEKGHWP